MKSFKFFITENYKLPTIETQFGSNSLPKKDVKKQPDEEEKKEDEVIFNPVLSSSIVKEEDESSHITNPHSAEETKKFHTANKMKDEISSEAKNHKGWLRHYSDYSTMMNTALHDHHANKQIEKTAFNDPERHQRSLSFAQETDKILSKHKINSDHTVFTGVPQKHAEKFKNQKEPLKVHHPAFISTSTDFEQAAKFTGNTKKQEQEFHVLKIHVPKGTHGGSMSGNTYYPKEKEVVLHRGHDLEIHHEPTIINHPKHGKIHVWNAKIVGHNPKPLNAKPLKDVLYSHEKN